jgi:hypothetical protein
MWGKVLSGAAKCLPTDLRARAGEPCHALLNLKVLNEPWGNIYDNHRNGYR